ncbi:MAG TPA: SIS domain-containing protein [Steroidobacteraceae bacterium]|nr:SIS domain-containing protein [Steroidobacteraceae bacterium]
MTYLGIDEAGLARANALHTAREIEQQPDSWERTLALMSGRRTEVQGFLAPLLARPELQIILTGAGSSAFIGECMAPTLSVVLGRRVLAIATTDLLTHPRAHLLPNVPTLLVSFGRSGGSPESLAVVELAARLLSDCSQLIITCNEQGELFQRYRDRRGSLALLMPAETHDQSFAMTSSFTAMMLAAWLALGGATPNLQTVARITAGAREVLSRHSATLRALAGRDFTRVVYLGSNCLQAIARESALKLLELTDGKVVAVHESSLGFRHGPKTIVDSGSLLVMFLSNDPYARHYDLDLLRELRAEGRAGAVLAISAQPGNSAASGESLNLEGLEGAADSELAFPYVVCGQLYAFYRALSLGGTPDQPSQSGTVSRVVRGVTIHSWQG